MKASSLKDEGNDLMKQNKYEEAIEKYSEAIQTVPNAIYYCNRAAAYSKVYVRIRSSETKVMTRAFKKNK